MWWRKKRSFEDFKEEIESHLAIEADEIRDARPCADSDAAARRVVRASVPTKHEAFQRFIA